MIKFRFGLDASEMPASMIRNKYERESKEHVASAGPKLWAFEAHEGSRIAEEAGIPSQRLPNGRIVRYFFKSDVHRALY